MKHTIPSTYQRIAGVDTPMYLDTSQELSVLTTQRGLPVYEVPLPVLEKLMIATYSDVEYTRLYWIRAKGYYFVLSDYELLHTTWYKRIVGLVYPFPKPRLTRLLTNSVLQQADDMVSSGHVTYVDQKRG